MQIYEISNSRINDSNPNWFVESSFQFVFSNLYCNLIHGKIPNLTVFEQFTGSNPLISSNVTLLDLSSNAMSGSLSHFLCYEVNKSKKMQILNLKDNFLSGQLPDCWLNQQYLLVLDLANNTFKVPSVTAPSEKTIFWNNTGVTKKLYKVEDT